ncbi:MAG TPA: hypothetical protein VF297_07655 [Pyrinomonadaceae bacterium]
MRVALKGLLLCMLSAAGVVAAAAGLVSAQERRDGRPLARKVDEFPRLRGCDPGARLDNFFFEMENSPGAKGYIVARDSRERLRGAAHVWGESFVRYFEMVRGLEASRFVLIDAAAVPGEDLSMELWLVPAGAEPPTFEPRGKKESRPFSGKYAELSVFDEKTFNDVDGSSGGAFTEGMLYSAYAGVLKKQPDAQGYLVVYSPPEAAPGYWQRAGTREQAKIAWHEVGAERLTVISGGVVPPKKKSEGEEEEVVYGHIELWVGKKESPPVKHVEVETALTEAVLLGTNSFYEEEDDAAAWMLNNLAAMMRADSKAVGCIIVYPGDGGTVPYGEGGTEKPAPDVFKIAEGWKAALLKKHGFEPGRVVVMNGPREAGTSSGRLETWAVPYGATMPDPFAEEAQPAFEQEGEGQGTEDGDGQSPPQPPGSRTGVNLKWQ